MTASLLHAVNIGVVQTFNTIPGIGEFSTVSIPGTGGTITTLLDLETSVQTNADLRIFTNALNSTTSDPIANLGLARWSSTGLYIGTRPTGNDYVMMLARVTNSTAGNLSSVVISYDLTNPNPLPASEDPDLNGQRVYYSLTGTANSWTLIPELTTATPGPLLASVTLGSWPRGAQLFILWVDDNGGPGTDSGFQIDNFLADSQVDQPVITRQPVGTNIVEGQTIQLSVVATGPALSYQWQKVGGSIDPANPTVNQPTLVITNATTADSGTYFVVVANPAGAKTSLNAVVGVSVDTVPPTLVSGSIDPLDSTLVTVVVSEPLCVDAAACGAESFHNFVWHIRPKDDPANELGVSVDATIVGTTVTLVSGQPRQPGTLYFVTVDAFSIGDLHGNINQTELSVDLAPAIVFKQGVDGYVGTQDTFLTSDAPDTLQGALTYLESDAANPGGGISQGLLRFDGVFGSNPGQVPLGAVITSATLILQHGRADAEGTPVALHRMLVPWDQATATWNSLTGGVQIDGTDAMAATEKTIISAGLVAPFTLNVDVTASMQAWSDGQSDFGWVFINSDTGGYRPDSSESGTPPALVVAYRLVACTTAPVITQQPAATVSATEGSPFIVSVAATACNATFQWAKDGVDIAGANQPSYTAVAVAGAGGSAGSYRVRITNPNGSVLSSAAVVTVINDSTRPRLTSAEASLNGTTITLVFSKSMKTSTAQTTGNYVLTPSVAVTSAVLGSNGTVVTLTTGPRGVVNYTLRISNLTDDRFLANQLDPSPTSVPITGVSLVLGYGAGTWKYETNSQDATLAGTPWYAPGFNDTAWQSGQAFFGFETGAAVTNALPPPRIVTPLPPNSDTNFPDAAVTAYFRRTVTLPALPAGGVFAMCHYIDDGAVFHLDGVELARFNMPTANPVVFITRATVAGEAALSCFFFTASAGSHLLAIEVHQGGVTTSDVVFGAEIVALPAPPRLTIGTATGGLRLNWTGDAAWELVGSGLVTGGFNGVPGNPLGTFLLPTASLTTNEFFHLRYRDPQ